MNAASPVSGQATAADVESDAAHLYHLLDVAVNLLQEVPFERDGRRDVQLAQINSLLWIARDSADRIRSCAETLP